MTTLRFNRVCAIAFLGVLGLAAQDPVEAAPEPAPGPAHVRVIWTEAPATAAVISWSTLAAGERHVVRYDTASRASDPDATYAHEIECQRSGRFSNPVLELYYHHARIEGLQPSATYWFTVHSDGQASREFHFQTAPADGRAFRLLSGGDSRSDRPDRRRVNTLIARLAGADPQILAFVHGGDYIYNGKNLTQWAQWLTDHELTVTAEGRILPIIPARGNHEATGPLFDEVFDAPGGADRNWYVTQLGSHVRLITLNSERPLGGHQRTFLESALRQARADAVRWQLAQYHTPAWPAVKQPGPALQHWVPLFDEYDVDLVLESDGHSRKRTVPIRDGKPAASGVVYIGEGGLGVKPRSPDSSRWYLQEPGTCGSDYHVWELTFDANELSLRAVGLGGTVLDRAMLKPRDRG